MKNNKIRLVFLSILFTIMGCLSDVDQSSYPESPEYNTSAPSADVSADINTSVQSSEASIREGYVINLHQQIKINSQQEFAYYSYKGVVNNNTYLFTFNQDNIEVIFKRDNFHWKSLFRTGEWDAHLTLEGTQYGSTVLSDENVEYPITLFINNDKELTKIKLGDAIFNKIAPVSKVNVPLKYMDNHQVVVRRGDTLRGLVNKYNKENPSSTTSVEEVVSKNPRLKGRKNFYLVTGEIIQF